MEELIQKTEQTPKKKAAPRSRTVTPVTPTVTAPIEAPYISPREARRREVEAKWRADKAHKSKTVTGKFLFNECPGGELKFSYCEFPGDQLVHYTMRHDSIHTIPLGVAMHLNDRCAYPEFQHNLDGGKAISGVSVGGSNSNMYLQSMVHRTNFIPLDFTLNAGNYSGIVEVSHTPNGNPLDSRYNLDATGR
ncbi:MAG: hypothetical protein ACRDL7_00525 [Gaiellaceae bacterium]